MIRVLIVDDSKVVQEFISYILSSDPEIRIAGTALSGEEALQKVVELNPDVITMDINMPGIGGAETTRRIMESRATPIVVVTGSEMVSDRSWIFSLLEAGALAVVKRPPDLHHPQHKEMRKELLQTVKLMSEVKVVRVVRKKSFEESQIPTARLQPETKNRNLKIFAVGASTGGPATLQKILSGLPKNLPVPVVIVQHITKEFITGLQEWLSGTSSIPVKIATDGESLQKGVAYFAPDNFHLGVTRDLKVFLDSGPPINGLRPAIDFLFRSVADNIGVNAAGVLLTGMGKDGAEALKKMKDSGATTIAQDEESSIVFGMPGEAIKLGAVNYVLTPPEIAVMMGKLAGT